MKSKDVRTIFGAILAFAGFLLCGGLASAQSNQIKGVINERNGATMTVQTQDSGNVIVLLTDSTQVEEPEGAFRKKHYSMAALVPGLSVEVKGTYNAQNQMVAGTVKFHGSDLKTAQDIQAGLAPVQQQIQQNQAQDQAQIQAQQQEIQQQSAELQAEQKASAEHAAEIAANQAAIAAANKRFGELENTTFWAR
jgi:OOP family OmpA-OmpF porin